MVYSRVVDEARLGNLKAPRNGSTVIWYIILEGPVGVGKTTLMKLLAERIGAVARPEDGTSDPLFGEGDSPFSGYPFQARLHSLLVRFLQNTRLSGTTFSEMVVFDHLFAIDNVYARLHLSSKELELYSQYSQLLCQRILKPDLVVYLRASTDVLMQRLHLAGQSFIADMGREYIHRVNLAFDEFFDTYEDSPLWVVDTDDFDYANVPRDFDAFCEDLELQAQLKVAGPDYRLPNMASSKRPPTSGVSPAKDFPLNPPA